MSRLYIGSGPFFWDKQGEAAAGPSCEGVEREEKTTDTSLDDCLFDEEDGDLDAIINAADGKKTTGVWGFSGAISPITI